MGSASDISEAVNVTHLPKTYPAGKVIFQQRLEYVRNKIAAGRSAHYRHIRVEIPTISAG